jgi:serine/threonine protein kinase
VNEWPSLLDDLSDSAVTRLDDACSRFEESWQAGQRPRLEDFLAGSDGPERLALLRELLRLEVYYRRRAGDRTAASDYATRIPEAIALVAEVFAPATNVEPAATGTATDTPARPPAVSDGDAEADAVPAELADHPRYRVVRRLGGGGMGTVYEVEHRLMKRRAALKVIKRSYLESAGAVERFRREVHAAARLLHPNIVTAFDAEQAGDTHFLVMEYVEGSTLGRLVRRGGPLAVAEACDHVRQAALGLQHAHERGMVHRDVKPDNLMLTPDGTVKVLDFGLASLTAERDAGGLSQPNAIMGTAEYIAPEQAEDAHSADSRADVYSLGCTLYYLLTGEVPYPAPTTLLKILAHRERPVPSVRRQRPDVPDDLAAVVTRLLAKRPDDRYPTAAEVAAALTPFTTASPPAPPKRRRRRLIAVPSVLLVGVVVAVFAVFRAPTERGEPPTSEQTPGVAPAPDPNDDRIHVLQRVPIPGKTNVAIATTVAPDGKRFAATFDKGGNVVWDGQTGKELYWPGNWLCWFSPDGQSLVAIQGNAGLTVHDAATGGRLRTFFLKAQIWAFEILPDSRHAVAYTADKQLHLCDLDTAKETHSWPTDDFDFAATDDGRILLVKVSGDQVLHVWDVEHDRPSDRFAELTRYERVDRFLPGNRRAEVKDGDRAYLADAADGRRGQAIPDHPQDPPNVTGSGWGYHFDCSRELLGYADGRLALWDRLRGQAGASLQLPDGERLLPRHTIRQSPDGRYACVASDRSVYLLRLPDPPADGDGP